MSYYIDELGRRVNEQDRPQVEASQNGLRQARERKAKQDYDEAVKQYEIEVKAEEERYEREKAQYEKELAEYNKQKAEYDKQQARLQEILKEESSKQAYDTFQNPNLSDVEKAKSIYRYRDTKLVKDFYGISIPTPNLDAVYANPKRTPSGSEINQASHKDFFLWQGGSEAQWQQILEREKYDRQLSQMQSKYLRESGNAQIQQAQKAELERLGYTPGANLGPAFISKTLTQGTDRVTKPIPVTFGIAEKAQYFGKGFTEQTKQFGFIPSTDLPKQKESLDTRLSNILSSQQQTEKAQIPVLNSKEPFHIGNEKQYFFDGKEVKDKSAQRLIDFQQGLKTTKRPSATIYKGILQESNLPVTPLATKIIDTLSSKGTFLGYSEPKQAKGKKATYTNPITGESFNTETKTGSPTIAKQLGFVYSQNMELPEIKKLGIGDENLKYSFTDIETVRAPIGNLEFLVKTNQLTPNPKSKSYIPQLQAPQGIKPISSTGQRFEFLLSNIEKEQLRVSKYDDDVGKMYHASLEFGKDTIAGGAFVENLLWKGEALSRNGQQKTRDIEIPHTMFTTGLEQVINKNPVMVIPSMLAYEKKYGKGSGLGAGASLLLPIPGSEVKLGEIPLRLKNAIPQYIKTPVGKVAERLHYPILKNKFEGIYFNIESAKNLRTVKKYAISRQQEGIFGIEKVNPKLFIITRGLEESALPKIRGYSEKQVIGFTKKDNVINPIYSKIPSKQIFPRPQINEPIAELSIIKFERRKPTLVTDIFKPDRPVTPVSQRIVASSLDPEFYRTAKTLGMSNVKQGTYDLRKPSMKRTTEFFKLEKESQLNLVALGYTAPLKQVKELSKIEKLFRVKQSPISFVGSKAQVTRFYETSGMGLGKGKGFIERLKSKDFISVGSKDMDKALERAGLGTKRVKEQQTPYDTSQYKIFGTGSGKASALSELTKKNVKMSYGESLAKKINEDEMKITGKMSEYEKKQYYKGIAKIRRAKLDKVFPNVIQPLEVKEIKTDYLSQQSNFKPKYDFVKSDTEIEYEKLVFPQIETPKIEIKLNSLVTPRQQTKTQTRTETKQNTIEVQKLQPLQIQRPRLDNALVTRQKIRERQVTKQVPRMAVRQIEVPILRIKSMQTPKLRERQLMKTPQLLKTRTNFRYRDPPEKTRRPPRRPVIAWWNDDSKKKKSKDESKKGNFYLGWVSTDDVTVSFKRRDITLGSSEKIDNLLKSDRKKVETLGFGKGKKVKFF